MARSSLVWWHSWSLHVCVLSVELVVLRGGGVGERELTTGRGLIKGVRGPGSGFKIVVSQQHAC